VGFAITYGALLLVLLPIFLVIRRLTGKRRAAAALSGEPILQQPHTLTLSDDAISEATPLTSAQYRWVSFTNWKETPNLFALRLTGRTGILIIPKRAATEEQQKQLREIFNVRIVTPTGAFPVTIPEKPPPQPSPGVPGAGEKGG
jgi:hypothetical protein